MGSSNSANMTIEDKVVQFMKENTLSALIGDDDAISELAKRAIKEGLFQPIKVPDTSRGYGHMKDGDSIVVAAARELSKTLADTLVRKLAETLLRDENILEMISKTFAESVSLSIREAAKQSVDKALDNIVARSHNDLVNNLAVNGLRVVSY